MNQPKKRNKYGRYTKEAADIIIEMLKEGVVQGKLLLANGTIRETSIHEDITDYQYPYQIGGYWYSETLNYTNSIKEHVLDIMDFTSKADRKEFKRRWKERYLKEVKPESSKPKSELTYPLFAKSKANGAVFLFTSVRIGVCVATGESCNSYGRELSYLINATNTKHWKHLTFAEAEAELFGKKDDS